MLRIIDNFEDIQSSQPSILLRHKLIRLPERRPIETSMLDGTILLATAPSSSGAAGLGSEGLSGGGRNGNLFQPK